MRSHWSPWYPRPHNWVGAYPLLRKNWARLWIYPNGLQEVGKGVSLFPCKKMTGTRSKGRPSKRLPRLSLAPNPRIGTPRYGLIIIGKSEGSVVPRIAGE